MTAVAESLSGLSESECVSSCPLADDVADAAENDGRSFSETRAGKSDNGFARRVEQKEHEERDHGDGALLRRCASPLSRPEPTPHH